MKSIFLIATSLVFLGCGKKLTHSPISSGGIPNPVSNPSFLPSPGGVKVIYEPPSDADFLYAEAHYTNNEGLPAKARSSVYSDTLTITGFANQDPEQIEIFSVNRAGKMSSPVPLTAIPGKPPHLVAAESMEITPYIGSIKYKWINPSASNIVVDIIADTTKLKRISEGEIVHSIYTKNKEESYYVLVGTGDHAYDASIFGAIVRDLYGNRSDTVYSKGADGTFIPKLIAIKEFQVKRAECSVISLTGDADWTAWSGQPYALFDNNRETTATADPTNKPFTSYDGSAGGYPYYLTIKFNRKLSISRFILFQRNAKFRGGPGRFNVYGLADLPNSANIADPENGNPANWTLLQEYFDKSPSGATYNKGTFTEEDNKYWEAGSTFRLDSENAQQALSGGVQYLRFEFRNNFIESSFLVIGEMEFYVGGDEEGETVPRNF